LGKESGKARSLPQPAEKIGSRSSGFRPPEARRERTVSKGEMNNIILGDCLEVLKTFPNGSVDFVATDPPYLVEWQSNRRKDKWDIIANDKDDSWILPVFSEIYRVMKPDSLCLTFYGWPDADKFVSAFKQAGFGIKSHIVWVKNNMGLGWFTRGQHEQAYLLSKGHPEKPENAISDVIHAVGTGNELHPTQKPISLMAKIIRCYTKEGDIVLDPFCGSGTTLMAAKQMGRNYIGIEVSEEFYKVASERVANAQVPMFL
jgi:adenine-specific DNA-methyltransferase